MNDKNLEIQKLTSDCKKLVKAQELQLKNRSVVRDANIRSIVVSFLPARDAVILTKVGTVFRNEVPINLVAQYLAIQG